jgi:hypothetical protein
MASAKDIASFQNRSVVTAAMPVPVFSLSELPSKIARIDPAGARAWQKENNAAITRWISAQNSVNIP